MELGLDFLSSKNEMLEAKAYKTAA